MTQLDVVVVSPERAVWSGEASAVFARTLTGELGILGNHTPVLGVLVDGGLVRIVTDDTEVKAAVNGGFLSVNNNKVQILAEQAELGHNIEVAAVQSELAALDEDDEAGRRWAQARLDAAGA